MANNDTDLNELLESCAKRARNFHVNRAVVAAIIATTVAESTQGPQGQKRADDHPFFFFILFPKAVSEALIEVNNRPN
jgi:hypothetical protein